MSRYSSQPSPLGKAASALRKSIDGDFQFWRVFSHLRRCFSVLKRLTDEESTSIILQKGVLLITRCNATEGCYVPIFSAGEG